MSLVWNKTFVIVVILHLAILKVCWVGLVVPAPAPQADFVYTNKGIVIDSMAISSVGRQEPLTGLIPEKSHIDTTPWQILNQPKKDYRDVRLGL